MPHRTRPAPPGAGASPIEVLERWERHGATWKVRQLSDALAIVDLCTCHGEPVETLETADAATIQYLRDRPDGP